MSEYKLVHERQINGITVRSYTPVLSEEERKKAINEIVINLLNEYNRLEAEKTKIAI